MPQQYREHEKKNKPHREAYNDDEEGESEPEEIQQITQINRILPDKNDPNEIKMQSNGKYQNFTIDNASPVTIMLNCPELCNQKDIQALKGRYQDVNIMKLNSWGKYGVISNTMVKSQNYQNLSHKETTSHHY